MDQLHLLLVPVSDHTPEKLLELLVTGGLDEAWLQLLELQGNDGSSYSLLVPYDLRGGQPLDLSAFGTELSDWKRTVVTLTVDDPDSPAEVSLKRFYNGDNDFVWEGPCADFVAEMSSGEQRGADGMAAAFAELTGGQLQWGEVLEQASATAREGRDEANLNTFLVMRGRVLSLPIGLPRQPEVFYFHLSVIVTDEDDDELDVNPDELMMTIQDQDMGEVELPAFDEDDGDKMTIVLLDSALSEHLWEQTPSGQVAAFLDTLMPIASSVLGPLAPAIPETINYIHEQPSDLPLASVATPESLPHYEVVCMSGAMAYLSGDAVSYYDEKFLPLLTLADTELSVELLRSSLDDMSGLGVLEAMAEVLPYSVPEGQLLESFADEELSPLMGKWAKDDYEGSLFLLDAKRLIELTAAFDPEAFVARVERFLDIWGELSPEDAGPASEARHRADVGRFNHRMGELRALLALAETNSLQPAVLFFSV